MKIAVFVSGTGTNLLNIIKKTKDGFLKSEVRLVISDRGCEAIEISRSGGIQTAIIDPKNYPDESGYGKVLMQNLEKCEPDLVVLAGFLKRIPNSVVKNFANRIINVHPALLPSFGGKGMYGMKVHRAVLDYGCKVSGATVHVVDTEYDHGPVLLQRCVPVKDDDTPESLASRIHQVEYEVLPEAIKLFEESRVEIEGRKAFIKW